MSQSTVVEGSTDRAVVKNTYSLKQPRGKSDRMCHVFPSSSRPLEHLKRQKKRGAVAFNEKRKYLCTQARWGEHSNSGRRRRLGLGCSIYGRL